MSGRRRVDFHGVVLTLMWLAATGALVAYVAALLWHLSPVGLSMARLPASPLGHAADGSAGRGATAGAPGPDMGRGQTVGNLLGAALGYALPMAVVFVRRDWEHAVGAHYAINVLPWVLALLAN